MTARKVYKLEYRSRDGYWNSFVTNGSDPSFIRQIWKDLDHDLEWRLRVYEITPTKTVPRARTKRISRHEFPWNI
jgi:hypothetical protein